VKKFRARFSDNFYEILVRRAAIKRTSIAAVIRNAILIYEYLTNYIMENPGLRVALVDKDEKVVKLLNFEL